MCLNSLDMARVLCNQLLILNLFKRDLLIRNLRHIRITYIDILLRRLQLAETVETHFEACCSQPEVRWDLKQSCLLGTVMRSM
jgi:hypothetical protein